MTRVLILLFLTSYGCIFTTLSAKESKFTSNIRVQQAPLFAYSFAKDQKFASIDWMFQLTPYINIGPVYGIYNDKEDNYSFQSQNIGLRLDLVFNLTSSFSDGFYLSNAILKGKWNSRSLDESKGCTTLTRAQGKSQTIASTFGYQWFWANGYNVNFGLGGFETNSSDIQYEVESLCGGDVNPSKETFQRPWIDFGLGYAF